MEQSSIGISREKDNMTNKTGLGQLVDTIEAMNTAVVKLDGTLTPLADVRQFLNALTTTARALLAEGQPQTLNSSLVKDINLWALKWPIQTTQGALELRDILEKYTPQESKPILRPNGVCECAECRALRKAGLPDIEGQEVLKEKAAANADMVSELEEIKARIKAFFDPEGNPPENTGEFAELKGAIKMVEYVIRGLEDRPVKANDDGELAEAIKLMTIARQHGGPVSYSDAEDSVGEYICCGNRSYEDHEEDCWYRKICEFLDSHTSSKEAKC